MALSTPTNLLTSNFGPHILDSNTFTTASFTPADNSILVIIATQFYDGYFQNNVGGVPSSSNDITISGGSLSYTAGVSCLSKQSGQDKAAVSTIFTAQVTTGASMTLTFGSLGTFARFAGYFVVENQTGHNTSTPTGASVQTGADTGVGSITITLSGAPASDSYVFAGFAYEITGFMPSYTKNSAWTQIFYNNNFAGVPYALQGQYRTASTSTSVTWDDITSDTTVVYRTEFALEIKAAGAGTASVAIPALSFIGMA